ncbi:hypothetical protein [Nocardioides daeguensis]|uniref:Uncharacterized protein n=1 Tax=Nocardioides daeguensis TaxID=908359 RepID=A0ABP6W9X5_9ACTN|nr:hypothetical protein [Nocardioides daeguensis]MBV6729635.1 hypothetical protein [Nocardioides daeguensis]MCR1775067.1 hypothetical protein [Nocardioides daeguensis]
MHRRPTLAALLLVAVGLAGCTSDPSPRSPSGGTGKLAGMPGVRDTWSGLREVEDGVRGLVIVADLEEDITPEQLTRVLVATEAASPEMYTLSLGWGELPRSVPADLGDRDVIDGAYGPLEATAGERAPQFLAASRTFDGSVTLTPRGTEVVLADDSPDGVTAALDATLADPVLQASPQVSVRTGEQQATAASGVAWAAPLTADLAERWRRLRATLDLAPEGARANTWLREGNDDRLTEGEVPPGPPLSIHTRLVLPGVTGEGEVTPATWGDRLWPLIRPQLDVTGTLPVGSTYELELDLNPGGLPKDEAIVGLTVGEGAGDQPSAWDPAAARYLRSVT